MRVLIVDDEAAARRRLSIMLSELDVEVVGEAENGVEALEMAGERSPDVLLLDIAMPEVDGFDVARHLPDPKPMIVFQTAYDEYALEAFEHEAVDYLVKPVSTDALERALGRVRARLQEARRELPGELLARLRSAVAAASTGAVRSPRLLVRERSGHRLLPYDEILRFSADEGLIFAHTEGVDYLTDYTLKELEERTAGSFVRASRSELVNMERIVRFAGAGDGSAVLDLDDGTRVRVARRRSSTVREALEA